MALPTNLNTLDFSWNGKCLCQVPAKSSISLSTLDYSWNGKVFWGNSQTAVVTAETWTWLFY
jgi:hypothetical protein